METKDFFGFSAVELVLPDDDDDLIERGRALLGDISGYRNCCYYEVKCCT